MFVAMDTDEKRIHIDSAYNGGKYFCPICGEPVIVKAKNSEAVQPHFAHKKGTVCLDNWKHDMSEWHYNWQLLFPEECREVVVEKDGVKHRADVLINNTVIEFQHSPITLEEIHDRNIFYLGCGYRVIWVFDANNKVQNIFGKDYSIDPAFSQLEWKRARREFGKPMECGVAVFIEYHCRLTASKIEEADIMLLLENVSTKRIKFVGTYERRYDKYGYKDIFWYIMRHNFLKEFGICAYQQVPSVSEMIKRTTRKPYRRYLR